MKFQFDPNAHLEGLVNRETAQASQTYLTDAPNNCDLCGRALAREKFLVDGEAKGTSQIPTPDGGSMGQWAYMCSICFAGKGVGVQWGSGQLYEQVQTGRWLLVAGFPPQEE